MTDKEKETVLRYSDKMKGNYVINFVFLKFVIYAKVGHRGHSPWASGNQATTLTIRNESVRLIGRV